MAEHKLVWDGGGLVLEGEQPVVERALEAQISGEPFDGAGLRVRFIREPVREPAPGERPHVLRPLQDGTWCGAPAEGWFFRGLDHAARAAIADGAQACLDCLEAFRVSVEEEGR